jgi:hypothetical protein
MFDSLDMPHRIPHVLDSVMLAITTIVTAAGSQLLIADASTVAAGNELKLLLLPLIGALIMSGGCIMLNPSPEDRRKTIGRGIIALFFGAAGPQVIALTHPAFAVLTSHPVVLLVAGAVVSFICYVLSRPFVEGAFKRSNIISSAALDELQRRYGPQSMLFTHCAKCPNALECTQVNHCKADIT